MTTLIDHFWELSNKIFDGLTEDETKEFHSIKKQLEEMERFYECNHIQSWNYQNFWKKVKELKKESKK